MMISDRQDKEKIFEFDRALVLRQNLSRNFETSVFESFFSRCCLTRVVLRIFEALEPPASTHLASSFSVVERMQISHIAIIVWLPCTQISKVDGG